jgi:hypothetical protein
MDGVWIFVDLWICVCVCVCVCVCGLDVWMRLQVMMLHCGKECDWLADDAPASTLGFCSCIYLFTRLPVYRLPFFTVYLIRCLPPCFVTRRSRPCQHLPARDSRDLANYPGKRAAANTTPPYHLILTYTIPFSLP